MTTLASLASRDSIVIGCDSLATASQTILNPDRILEAFFDSDGTLRRDDKGEPVLSHVKNLTGYVESIPYNQLPNVTKIHEFKGQSAGFLFAGIAGIGNKSVKQLVEEFTDSFETTATHPFILSDAAKAFSEFLDSEFEENFKSVSVDVRPTMEVLLSGYSSNSRRPEIYRILAGRESDITNELETIDYDLVFGGQHDVIQRVVKGIDLESFLNLNERFRSIVEKYRQEIQSLADATNADLAIPALDLNQHSNQLFGENFGGVTGIFSDLGSLSEQAAINFVEFLITTMINAQEFSDRIPTVGGDVHIALITKSDGFKWISREEYQFKDHSVPKYESH